MKKYIQYLLLLTLLIFSLAACSSGGDSGNTFTSASSSDTGYLSVQLRADAGDKQVTLEWQMVKYAETYNVYWFEDTAGSYTAANPPGSEVMKQGTKVEKPCAPFILNGLTNGRTYWFAISANTSAGEGNLSHAIRSVPSASAPLPAPTNVRANNTGATTVTVTWSAVPGVSTYKLYYYTVFEGYTEVPGITGTSCNVTDLTTGDTYSFWVTAIDADNAESSLSFAYLVAPTEPHPPLAPVNAVATPGGASGEINITWDDVPGASYYIVYGGDDKGLTKTVYGAKAVGAEGIAPNPPISGFTATGLTNGTTYYFVVTAVDNNGTSDTADDLESSESNEVSATPAP